jgi:hypothetical protein
MKLSHIAIAGLTLTFALASKAQAQAEPLFITPNMVKPEPNAPISAQRTMAHKLFRSLTGVSLPIDDPRLKSMETLIAGNRLREAAKIATSDALFYQNKVRMMASKMSNRDESYRAPLTDFVATFVGVVRDSDSTSAKELLTGNFSYQADPALVATLPANATIRSVPFDDIVNSNNHYADITTRNVSLKAILKRVDGQVIGGPNNTVVPMPDPAGLITSRGFMQAHADAGTNRRLVEYSFRQFMCAPITDWADGTMPDDRIGRDVDRQPGGSANKFLTTCKNCHTGMDALRGAFARVDWNGQRITYTGAPNQVVNKMNRNADQYPQGFATTNDSFVNYSTQGRNKDAFGWRNALTGNGIGQFGAMLANSQGFSRCMVKRVFEAVCKRMPAESETSVVRQIADQFESDNYHMRNLFETVALRPECGLN